MELDTTLTPIEQLLPRVTQGALDAIGFSRRGDLQSCVEALYGMQKDIDEVLEIIDPIPDRTEPGEVWITTMGGWVIRIWQ
jgi:hypothetical protein